MGIVKANNKPVRISILATPDTSPSTLFGLYDVLSSVGVGWEIFIAGEEASPRFDVKIVAVENKPFVCAGSGGKVLITPDTSTEETTDTDIALIASIVPNDVVSLRNHDKREIEWLQAVKANDSILASVCTSTALLAEAGILDGHDATTFWAFRDLVRVRYPSVKWRVDQNICVAGDKEEILTGGGSSVWQELALYLVARFCGQEQAANTAKLWTIPSRDVTQAAFAVQPVCIPHEDNVINHCQSWIAVNYANPNPNPVAGMVKQTKLPPTTFTRRFKQATGNRPMDYVHMLRLEKAKKMLEISSESI